MSSTTFTCPDLDYGTSVHFTSPSGWQRLAQASVPNSIPPEGLQAMVGSLFSPQPITITQNDFDIRNPHTRPLYVEAFVDHYQIKRVVYDQLDHRERGRGMHGTDSIHHTTVEPSDHPPN